MNIPTHVKDLTNLIKINGGKAFLVGGAVIDTLQGNTPKDWDIEVHGIAFENLKTLLENAGLNPKHVGSEFGVLKVADLDISVPRTENKTGSKHGDFTVILDHTMSPREAARRRDLTINALLLDLTTFELIDPFAGLGDLNDGRLRATDSKTFAEDPLRVLRIMQLLPRKGKFVDSSTLDLCRKLSDQFNTLSKERVMGEFEKLLMKSAKPSIGLKFLLEVNWLKHFPELQDLVGCPHNPIHHPEGDVWEHTLLAVDGGAQILRHIPEEWKLAFMFGCLCHDLGKPSTTDFVELTSHGHDKAGEPLARSFMERLTNETALIDRVCLLTRNHMQPYFLDSGKAGKAAWRRLHNKVRLDILGWLALCDRSASDASVLVNGHKRSQAAWTQFMLLGAQTTKIAATLMGRHLIERGMTPGKRFGAVLAAAYELQLEDNTLTVDELYRSAAATLV